MEVARWSGYGETAGMGGGWITHDGLKLQPRPCT